VESLEGVYLDLSYFYCLLMICQKVVMHVQKFTYLQTMLNCLGISSKTVINSYYNMAFMIYKTGVTNGCLNLIHKNARSLISIGRNLDKSYTYDLTHNNYTISLECVDQIRDLGVLIDERLAFSNHIQDKINKAYAMLGVIKRNFKYLRLSSFVLLYKNMVRSHLDYCSSVWTHIEKEILKI